MMKFKKYFSISLFISLATSLCALAGAGSSGGGADSLGPTTGAAWFIGEGKQIKVCTDVSAHFGMPNGTDPKTMIQAVFKNWQNYVNEKQIEKTRAPILKLVFDLKFLSTCDGSEDLAFYFGDDQNNPDSIEKTKAAKKLYDDPLAFANRQSFDEKLGWGKGFVWVKESDPALQSPTVWQNPLRLQAILMHEVGHILGCDHVTGTVMQASLGEFINQSAYRVGVTRDVYFANHIDGATQLYWCISCKTEVPGEIGTPKRFEPKTGFDPRITFKRFMDREAAGKITATFKMELNENNDHHPFKTLSLTYADAAGKKTFPFLMRQGGAGFDQSNDSSVFRVYTSASATGGTASPTSIGGVFEGFIRDAQGKLRPLTITINSANNNSWIQINYADGLIDLPLFRAPSTPKW